MPFLKQKIQLKQRLISDDEEADGETRPRVNSEATTQSSLNEASNLDQVDSTAVHEFLLPMRKPRQKPTCPKGHSKNIVKNYGKALCAFASSHLAVPYLENMIEKNDYSTIEVVLFAEYIKEKKAQVNNIESLRRLLIVDNDDDDEMSVYKKLFKEISIIFLKYFSVNWIYSGRLKHKDAHLKFRFNMLRRVQNPEKFTYLKAIVKS